MEDSKAKISFPSPTNNVAEDRTEPQPHPQQTSADASAEQLLFVPIHLLERNPSQPRSIADEEKLEELISTILLDGLIAYRSVAKGRRELPNCRGPSTSRRVSTSL